MTKSYRSTLWGAFALTASALMAAGCQDLPVEEEGVTRVTADGGELSDAEITFDLSSNDYCYDLDHDGYGSRCVLGADCDDFNAEIHENCGIPTVGPGEACDAEPNVAYECYSMPLHGSDSDVLVCQKGQKVCQGGHWTDCFYDTGYVLDRHDRAPVPFSITGPGACSPCDPICGDSQDVPGTNDVCTIEHPDASVGCDGGTVPTNASSVVYDPAQGLLTLGGDAGTTLPDSDGDGTPNTLDKFPNNALLDGFLDGPDTDLNGIPDRCDSAGNKTLLMGLASVSVASGVYSVNSATTLNNTFSMGVPSICDPTIPSSVCACMDKDPSNGSARSIFHTLPYYGSSVTDNLQINIKVKTVDIYILFDNTGSMGGQRTALQSSLGGPSGIIAQVQSAIPDAWFGLGWFQDFGSRGPTAPSDYPFGQLAGSGTAADKPYNHVLNITNCAAAINAAVNPGTPTCPPTASTINWATVNDGGACPANSGAPLTGTYSFNALSTCYGSGGPDDNADSGTSPNYPNVNGPEAIASALVSSATKNAITRNPDAGMITDYPSRATNEGTGAVTVCGVNDGGTLGYPCFRPSAFPIYLAISNSPMHFGPTASYTGTSQTCTMAQIQAGTCTTDGGTAAPALLNNYYPWTTAGNVSNMGTSANDTYFTARDSLNTLGAKVVTVWSGGCQWACQQECKTRYTNYCDSCTGPTTTTTGTPYNCTADTNFYCSCTSLPTNWAYKSGATCQDNGTAGGYNAGPLNCMVDAVPGISCNPTPTLSGYSCTRSCTAGPTCGIGNCPGATTAYSSCAATSPATSCTPAVPTVANCGTGAGSCYTVGTPSAVTGRTMSCTTSAACPAVTATTNVAALTCSTNLTTCGNVTTTYVVNASASPAQSATNPLPSASGAGCVLNSGTCTQANASTASSSIVVTSVATCPAPSSIAATQTTANPAITNPAACVQGTTKNLRNTVANKPYTCSGSSCSVAACPAGSVGTTTSYTIPAGAPGTAVPCTSADNNSSYPSCWAAGYSGICTATAQGKVPANGCPAFTYSVEDCFETCKTCPYTFKTNTCSQTPSPNQNCYYDYQTIACTPQCVANTQKSESCQYGPAVTYSTCGTNNTSSCGSAGNAACTYTAGSRPSNWSSGSCVAQAATPTCTTTPHSGIQYCGPVTGNPYVPAGTTPNPSGFLAANTACATAATTLPDGGTTTVAIPATTQYTYCTPSNGRLGDPDPTGLGPYPNISSNATITCTGTGVGNCVLTDNTITSPSAYLNATGSSACVNCGVRIYGDTLRTTNNGTFNVTAVGTNTLTFSNSTGVTHANFAVNYDTTHIWGTLPTNACTIPATGVPNTTVYDSGACINHTTTEAVYSTQPGYWCDYYYNGGAYGSPATCAAGVYSSDANQWRALGRDTNSMDSTGLNPVFQQIASDGTGLSSSIVTAIQQLANYLRQNITVSAHEVTWVSTNDPTWWALNTGVGGIANGFTDDPMINETGFIASGSLVVDPTVGNAEYVNGDCSALPLTTPPTYVNCKPGSNVKFDVGFRNTILPANPAMAMTRYFFIDVNGVQANGATSLLQRIPVTIVIPPAAELYNCSGYYQRDYDYSTFCTGNDLPSWSNLSFEPFGTGLGLVQPAILAGTSIGWSVWTTNTLTSSSATAVKDTMDALVTANPTGQAHFTFTSGTSGLLTTTCPAGIVGGSTDNVCIDLHALLVANGLPSDGRYLRVRATLYSNAYPGCAAMPPTATGTAAPTLVGFDTQATCVSRM